MGLVRMIRPRDEGLVVRGRDIAAARPEVTDEEARAIIRNLVGVPALPIEPKGIPTWTVNDACATPMRAGREFVMGDSAHRHPPSNGLGSNTSIQDAFNFAWKLAMVLWGQAGDALLDRLSDERAPFARQVVARADTSIPEFGPIFEAQGMEGSLDHARIAADMAARADATPEPAVARDAEPHPQPPTWPSARLPHAWVWDRTGRQVSTLDLAGHDRVPILTGIGGAGWAAAAEAVGASLGIDLRAVVIGPQQAIEGHAAHWARAREASGAGCLLVRPDHHAAWRNQGAVDDPASEPTRVLTAIQGRRP